MDKWFKDILPDKDPYHNLGRDEMRKKGGPEFECLCSLLAANVHIDLNTLLFGSQIYNIDTNRHVFITVQTYIKETCRFSFR